MKKGFSFIEPYKGLPSGVYILFISKIVNSVGAFIIPLLTIILTDAVGLSSSEAGIYVSISGFLFVPGSIIGGKLTDNFGRKNIIVIFGALSAVVYSFCIFIEPTLTLVYLILIAEFFHIIIFPAQDSLLGDLTNKDNRDGAFSLAYLGRNIGMAVGPLIGGILYHNYFRMIFIGDAITALISIALVALLIVEPEEKDRQSDDNVLEKNMDGSIFDLLKQRPYLFLFLVLIFGYYFVYSTWSFILPIQIMEIYEEGAGLYGMLSSFNGVVVVAFTALITKFLSGKRNLKKLIYSGLLYSAGIVVFGYSEVMIVFFAGMLLFALGEIAMSISSMPFVANNTPGSHRGRMNSLLPLVLGIGVFLGPLLSGYLLREFSTKITWFIIAGVMLLFTFGMFILDQYHLKKYYKIINDDLEEERAK